MNAYNTCLSPTEAAYIAGVIDGEGTVTLTRKHRNENRQLAVTISNTEVQLLEYALRTIGAGKITGKRTVSERHTPSFTYAIYNQQALRLLEQISPYLRTYKAERTSIILQEYRALTPPTENTPIVNAFCAPNSNRRCLALKLNRLRVRCKLSVVRKFVYCRPPFHKAQIHLWSLFSPAQRQCRAVPSLEPVGVHHSKTSAGVTHAD